MGKKVKLEQTSGKGYYNYIIPLLIIIGSLIVYNPSLDHEILDGWDDMEYMNDPAVQDLNLAEVFSNFHLGMYQPLSVSTLALNYNSAELSPKAYHATNLFFHIINILLVWIFLFMLSKKKLIAGIGAFLFAFHPINVEPVVWISARSTLMVTAFYLGGLLAYLKYIENKKLSFYVFSFVLALLAFFSKSLALSFPFALLIIDYYRGRTFNSKLLLEKAPFILLSVVFGIIAINAAQTFGHISDLAHDYNLIDRFFILCHTYVLYLVKFILPIGLSPIYAYPDTNGTLPILYYLSAVVPLGLLYLMIRLWSKQKEIIAGLLFFSITISPVLPLFWSRIFVAADRYAYLSFIGLFMVLAYGIHRLSQQDKFRNTFLKYVLGSIIVIYGGLLIYLTHQQTKFWINSESILSRAVYLSNTSSNKALAYFYRGNIYQNIAEEKFYKGYNTSNKNMVLNSQAYYRMTITDYDSCLQYNPASMMAYANRGMAYMSITQYDTNYRDKYAGIARQDLEMAISLDSTYADNYFNLGWVFWIQKDPSIACELWKKADELGSVVAYQPLERYCK